VAAAEIARRIDRPFLLAARGSDVNVVAHMPGPRRRILRAVEGSAGVIAVSEALKASLIDLGAAPERVTVLRNGVDTDLFRPEDRSVARIELGLPLHDEPLVICVGNLVEEKQPAIALEAALSIEGLHIAFVGRGPERPRLERLANERMGQGRVWFLEEMTQARLRFAYSAADALVLSSAREGWPNVLLEAAACGTPSVAFPVGGVPEILGDLDLGVMTTGPRDTISLSGAIRRLIGDPPARAAVRAAAARFAWEPVLEDQMALYRSASNVDGSLVIPTARLEPA
jgi:glycosyltransferase involved in cell wall biosynthesis